TYCSCFQKNEEWPRTSIIGIGARRVKGVVPGRCPEVVARKEFICYDATHATLPSLVGCALCRRRVGCGWRVLRTARPRHGRQDSGTLQDVHGRAERDRVEI